MFSNKRGQVLFLTFMIGITIVVLALALASPLKERIDETMDGNNLDCANNSISSFDKGACVVADLTMFQFVAGLIFIAGAVITARLVFT